MKADGFFSLQGAINHGAGDIGQISEFDQVAGDAGVPIIFPDFLLEQLNPFFGAGKPLV